MNQIICVLFFSIGIAASMFFICSFAIDFIDKRDERERERKEQRTKLLSILDRIEANTRNKPNHS